MQAAVPNEKTASEEGDRFAFSICFAGSTGERGSQAILTSLSSLLIALRSLFVEIAQAIKAILSDWQNLRIEEKDIDALIVFPYLGIFAYMITQATGMAERSSQQAQQTREELRKVVGFSVADEIEKLDRLKKSGSITDQEFARLRAKLAA